MAKKKITQDAEELKKLQEESEKQALPEQKRIFSLSEKIRRRVHNLPDPARMPLGYDEHKAYDRVFPYIRLPRLHPPNHGDTVIFNAPDFNANQLILGDNLEVLRTLPSESIDLIYIDPPFFSGRNYNVIWGDSNEVRSFHDIWEGGIDSYLIWLNARLWEMRRVLKRPEVFTCTATGTQAITLRRRWIKFLGMRILGMRLYGRIKLKGQRKVVGQENMMLCSFTQKLKTGRLII